MNNPPQKARGGNVPRRPSDILPLPPTIAHFIAALARANGDTVALAASERLARGTNHDPASECQAFTFVDHSEAVFFGGKLFTIKLTFDIPGESRLPAGIETPWLGTPTEAEDAALRADL